MKMITGLIKPDKKERGDIMRSFADLHPAVLLLSLVGIIITSVFATNPVIQLIALISGLLTAALYGRIKSSQIIFYCTIFILTAFTNPLFSHRGATPLLFINDSPITLEAFVYGLLIAAMLVSVMLWCTAFNMLITADKILCIFGKIAPQTALVFSSVLRLVPLLIRRFKAVTAARRASGATGDDNYMSKVKSASSAFTAVIAWSLENSVDTVASMNARGYGAKKRTHYQIYRFTFRDALSLVLCVLLLGIVICGMSLGYTAFECYPSITAISFSPFAVICYAAFAALAFMPSAIEITARLKWRYCLSKV